jgi:hypothetical protein
LVVVKLVLRVKVKVSLPSLIQLRCVPCLIKHHAVKTLGSEDTAPCIPNQWSVSLPGRFTPRERVFGTHWIGGWVGPRADLNAVAKGEIRALPLPGMEPLLSCP